MDVLLVEDEEITRAGLKASIDWTMGLNLLGEARNGAEALQIVERTCPDIVITDMRMPEMDGVAFLRALQRLNPDARVIVISAHTDYQYMRQAVVSKAVDYLVKPVSSETMNRLLRTILRESKETGNGTVHPDAKASTADFVTAFANHFLPGDRWVSPRLLEHARDLGGGHFFAQVIYLPHFDRDLAACGGGLPQFGPVEAVGPRVRGRPLHLRVGEAIEAIAKGSVAVLIRTVNVPSELVLVWEAGGRGGGLDRVDAAAKEVRRELAIYVGDEIFVGFGRMYPGYGNVVRSYREAAMTARAAACGFVAQEAADLRPEAGWPQPYYLAIPTPLRYVAGVLASVRLDAIPHDVTALFQMVEVPGNSESERSALLEALAEIVREVAELKGTTPPTVLGAGWKEGARACGAESAKACAKWFQEALIAVRTRSETGSIVEVVRAIERYVKRRHFEDLNLNSLAQAFHVHPAYLSRAFREIVGESFVQFVTHIRVERSRRLLECGAFDVNEVAELVGYNNPYYFAKVFKRVTGSAPSAVSARRGPSQT